MGREEEHQRLKVAAEQIEGALGLLIEALAPAIADEHQRQVELGWNPDDDPALHSHLVRKNVRERILASFPDSDRGSANMSPIHLVLGPHQLRMTRANEGALPPPRTEARKAYYRTNDLGLLAMNIYPPDDLVAVDSDVDSIELAHLVLLWDSDGPELTGVQLCRPSMEEWPGASIELLSAPEAEEDLEGIQRQESVEGEHRTGTEDTEGSKEE